MMRKLTIAALLFTTACAEKEFTPPLRAYSKRIELQITTTTAAQQATPAPRYLFVAALYQSQQNQNDGQNFQVLSFSQVDLTGGTQRVTLPVDLAKCLADDTRQGSKDACTMSIAAGIMYRKYDLAAADTNANIPGEAYDFQLIGPFEAAPGRTPTIPPIDLSVTRFGVIGWTGDEALRLGGDETPAGFSGTMAGVPGSGVAPPILFAPIQGLVFPASAQGNTSPTGPYAQLAILENGKWRRVTASILAVGTAPFTDVTALSANEAYLAHGSGLLKFDGSAITRVSAVTDALLSVASVGAGAANKYVIAGGSNGIVWIGNTQTWQRYTIPGAPRLDGGVCITGPNEAFAASLSGGGLFRFDGTTWTSVPGPVANGKGNLQCPAPGQAFVQVNGSLPLRWTGTGWTQLPATGLGTRAGPWAVVSPTEIYLAGDSANVDRAFFRFNGTSWSEVGRLRSTQQVGRPWADPRGGAYFPSALGRVEKVAAAAVSAVSVVSYQPSLRDVVVTSPSSAFVVGAGAFLARWDGIRWSVDAPPAGMPSVREFRSVWSDGAKNAWAAGGNSAVVRYDGAGWSAVSDATRPVAATDSYNGVWGSGSDVWVVGDNTILHCRPTPSCTNESSGGTGALNGVWGTSPANVFAVGAGGRIARYNGTSWTQMTSPGNATLYRVAGSGPNDVWAIGDSALFHFDGTQWTNAANAAAGGDLRSLLQRAGSAPGIPNTAGIWVRNAREVYITTPYGAVGRYDGTQWFEVLSGGFTHRIMGISGSAGGCVLAVTEGQQDNRSPTLLRGFGASGCFGAPMTGPTAWP
jgi:hypothetical protein